MYDINKIKEISKCPLDDVVCCRSEHTWSGFGCWCCTVATRGDSSMLPEWKDEYKNDKRYVQ